ncbi:MAG TPA: OmpA family protein, partial [Gemmatimonadales bacterium]|nr:OmpA family protein [Gemmatimonadales bacterium]
PAIESPIRRFLLPPQPLSPSRAPAPGTPQIRKVPMARSTRLFVPALGLALAAAACGKKEVAETPEPVAEAPAYTPAPAATPTQVAVEPVAQAADTRRATLEQRIHFDLDRAELSPEARTILSTKVEVLRSAPGISLRIDGHADERGSDEYNLALSKRRAAEAKRFLVSQGVDAARLETVGYGEEQPLDPTSSEAAWAQNRRADFQVSGGAFSQR